MKNYLKRFAYSFIAVTVFMLFLALIIRRVSDIEVSYIRITSASLFISAFISLAWSIFKMNRWNEILRIGLGFIALIPIVIMFRLSFAEILFKTTFVIYIVGLLVGLAYAIAVVVVSSKAKKEEKALNKMISDSKKEEK